ncbi:hypothetical protein T12_3547 [Trichinella patagoniensis]|uniref:Uncharacterized protein n=1 Tax=Trichinella patagoniensis TaxID=990121 RepID=A0A0V0Z9Z7_9BILA|nr:hypothetical protein T12_3547 [Trichinella patagoniensis]
MGRPAPAASPPRRYLPHHAVYQGSGDERKCRVVFDAAALYDGTKLNSQLEAGPIKDLGKRSSCQGADPELYI